MKLNLRNLKVNMVVIWMLIMLFLPTSISNTQIMASWTKIYCCITLALFFPLMLPFKWKNLKVLIVQLCGVSILVVCSVITLSVKVDFESEYGYIFLYLCLAILFSLELKKMYISEFYDKIFMIWCAIFLVAGILVIVGNEPLRGFLSTYFTHHREYGTYVAMQRGKPVGTFVQHSISAAMYFLMLVLIYFRNMKKKSIINYIFIVGFVFLIINLKSYTALALLGLGVFLLFLDKLKHNTFKSLIFKMGLIIGIVAVVLKNTNYISEIISSDVNGFAGRFTGTRPFLKNFAFLRNNLLPIGLTNSDLLFLTDCGYIVNLIRGGLVFVFIIYIGFILCVWKNCYNEKAAFVLLSTVLLFEIGYPILLEFRFIGFLPFYILYTNQIFLNSSPEVQKENLISGIKKGRGYENISRNSFIQSQSF